jgi:hypothetical protein
MGAMLNQMFKHGETIEAGHLNVEEDYIRLISLNQLDSLDSIRTLGEYVNTAHRMQQELQFFAGQLFVVDDQRRYERLDCEIRGGRLLHGIVPDAVVCHG